MNDLSVANPDTALEPYVTADGRQIGGEMMDMRNITLRFGGVLAINDISFNIREGEIPVSYTHLTLPTICSV